MRKVMFLTASALVVAGGGLFAVKYDDWVTNPKLIQQKREFVTQQLRDPSAVQFKDERLSENGWLCGQLNSKNAYGAYVGFKRFAVRNYDDAWIEGFGYAGKSGAQTTDDVVKNLDAQVKVMAQIRETRTSNPDFVIPSAEQIEELAEAKLFADRWTKHCT